MELRWEHESELALKAVSTGEEFIDYRPDRAGIVTKESLRDIATDVDVRIERHMTRILSASGHAVVGEEAFAKTPRLPDGNAPFWLVDPIDGTVNFVSGMPFYALSAGLCVGDQFEAGAVSLPAFKELFFTYGDRGSYLNGARLRSFDAELSSSLVGASFSGIKGDPESRRKQYEAFGRVNDASRGCLRIGSAASMISYTAAGRLQATYGLNAQLWDVAGGLAVARQAGCKIYFSRRPGSSRCDYIVGAPSVAEELRELLSKMALAAFEEGSAPCR